jgi:hypothetical protein
VATGFIQVHSKCVSQFGIGRVLNQVRESLGDLLLHVERLLQIVDVEGAKIFNVRREQFHESSSVFIDVRDSDSSAKVFAVTRAQVLRARGTLRAMNFGFEFPGRDRQPAMIFEQQSALPNSNSFPLGCAESSGTPPFQLL